MKKKIIVFGLAGLIGLMVGFKDAIINVADTTGKAVVSISTEHTTKIKGGRGYSFGAPFGGEFPFGEEDSFRRFFDDFFGEIPEREYKHVGLGSGVIIDPEGYILTNEHVVNEASKITVTLSDGRQFKGEVKGQDSRSDLAVIKINARNLPVATLGDSDDLRIGEWVVAIGNPFGFALQNPEPTVTAGVVSALHRSLGRIISRNKDYSDLIQTDAAINPGNSGGPLVNLNGEVVGINVAIFSTSGGYQGVGFAIPINNAKRIISQLIEGKKILYGWLGVTVQDLTDELAQYFGLSEKKGVLIANVLDESPAQKAGIKEGDVITGFDNKNVENVKEMLQAVAKASVGSRLKVALIRDKKPLSLSVEIGERPQDIEEAVSRTEETKAADYWRGLQVANLSSDAAGRFKTGEQKGVLIVDIQPESPAEQSGLMPGDVILKINKEAVNNLADYQRITGDLKGDCLIMAGRGYFVIKEK
ncbi:MAG: Do family serine endopeptidase [Candidatus Omnitrophota bacterium]|nr:Do family serine endopeptidase [Candidatus Omnitrophota bacterium]